MQSLRRCLSFACAAIVSRTLFLTVWESRFRQSPPSIAIRGTMAASAGATSAAFVPLVVYVTVPNKETGAKLARSLVETHLAACVNTLPGVESVYMWQGEVNTDSELLLMIKTRQSLLEKVEAHVRANHPYGIPEVIGVPIIGGSAHYLKWIQDNTI